MSEDNKNPAGKKDIQAPGKKDAIKKKPDAKPSLPDRLKRWLREMRSELKKVVWPSRKQLTNNSIIVLVSVVTIGTVIAGLDYVFHWVISQIIALF